MRLYRKLMLLAALLASGFLAEAQSVQQTAKEVIRLSELKFQNPLEASGNLFKLLSQKNLPDSIRGNILAELSVCSGMMNQIDSGIALARQALPLRLKPVKRVYLLKTLGILYSIRNNNRMADSSFREALRFCGQVPENHDLLALVLGEYANFHFQKADYVNNLRLLKRALEVRKKIKNDNPLYAASLRHKMSVTFLAMGNDDFAEKENLEIISLLENSSSNEKYQHLGYAYQDLALIRQRRGNLAVSDSLYKLSISIYKKLNNEVLAAYSTSQLAKNQYLRGNYQPGVQLMEGAFLQLKKYQSHYILGAASTYLNLLEKTGNFPLATRIMNDTLIRLAMEDNYSEAALEFLKAKIPLLSKAANPAELDATISRLIITGDSVYNRRKLQKILEIQASYQTEIQERDKKILQQENQILAQENNLKNRLLIIWLIIGTALILIYLNHSARQRLKLEKKAFDLREKEQENELLRQKAETEASEKAMKELIIEQQRLDLLHHSEKIQALELELEDNSKKILEEEKEKMRFHLQKMKEGKEHINLFMARFNSLYPGFGQMLIGKFPGISASDVSFCALLRINLSTKEIAGVLNIEPFSVYRRKYRLMEKMGIQSDDEFKIALFEVSEHGKKEKILPVNSGFPTEEFNP